MRTLFPKLVVTDRPPEPSFIQFIDKETGPWPTLSIVDQSVVTSAWREWGIFPGNQPRERAVGTFGSICFRFEEGTGRLCVIEVPSNLLRGGTLAPLDVGSQAPQEMPIKRICADLSFWNGASRFTESCVEAPVHVRVSESRLMVTFGADGVDWLLVAPRVWLGVSDDCTLRGLQYVDDAVNLRQFALAL